MLYTISEYIDRLLVKVTSIAMNTMFLLNSSFIGSYGLLFLASSCMALFVALDISLISRSPQVLKGRVNVSYLLTSSETISFHLTLNFSSSALSTQPSLWALVACTSQPPGHTVYKRGLTEVGLFTAMKNKQRGDLNDLPAAFDYLLGGWKNGAKLLLWGTITALVARIATWEVSARL